MKMICRHTGKCLSRKHNVRCSKNKSCFVDADYDISDIDRSVQKEFLKLLQGNPSLIKETVFNQKPMNPQQKIADLEKRQEEIAKELGALKKEMKSEISLGKILSDWAGLSRMHIYVADQRIMKISAIRDMIAVADYLNGDWKPDWRNENQRKYYIEFFDSPNPAQNAIKCDYCYWVQHMVCYFKTEALAEQAISILGEEKIKLALS